MKFLTEIAVVLWVSILSGSPVYSQVYENEADAREKHFIYKVKQIDEFFERFNDDSNSLIRRVYREKHIKFKVSRPELIRSLFDFNSNRWRTSLLDSFITNALPVQMPSQKNYYGENWLVQANCNFDYKNATISVPVFLKYVTVENKGSKWVIAGIKQSVFTPENSLGNAGDLIDPGRFISPAANGNYFIEMENVFNDKKYFASYFGDDVLEKSPSAAAFSNAVKSGVLRFRGVREIKYYFFQVNEYVFTVENFQRGTLNSGWLISELFYLPQPEKKKFIQNIIGDN